MEHNTVVGGIVRMTMGRPVAGVEMHLDVAGNRPPLDPQTCAKKIGAAQQVPFSRMDHAQAAPVRRDRGRAVEITAQPDFLQQLLGKRERAVESLHLGEGGGRAGARKTAHAATLDWRHPGATMRA